MELGTHSNIELSGLHERSEIKKDCFEAYMVTYQICNWIKADVHMGDGFMGSGPLPFLQIDQIVPSVLPWSSRLASIIFWIVFLKTNKVDCMFLSCHLRFLKWIHTL